MGSPATVESRGINLIIPINEVSCHCTDFHETCNHSNNCGHLLFWNLSKLDDICEKSSNVHVHSLNKACLSLHCFSWNSSLISYFLWGPLLPNSLKIQVWFSCCYVIAAGLHPLKALFFTLYIAPKMEFSHAYLSNYVFLIISSVLKWKRYNFHVVFCSYISDMFIAFPLLLCPSAYYFFQQFFVKSGVRLHCN